MHILVLVLVTTLVSAPLSAQDGLGLIPGSRVRVTVEKSAIQLPPGSYRPLSDTTLVQSTGVYESLTETTLLLASDSSTFAIPRTSLLRVEQSRGKGRSVGGGIIGFVVGAVAGVAVACLASRDPSGVPCEFEGRNSQLYLGVAVGGGAGAWLLATVFGSERWDVIDVPMTSLP